MSATDPAYYTARPCLYLTGWLAWGGLQPLAADCPISEAQTPIYFEFGDTEDLARAALIAEMTAQHGIREWIRCH